MPLALVEVDSSIASLTRRETPTFFCTSEGVKACDDKLETIIARPRADRQEMSLNLDECLEVLGVIMT
jgi:hypothetical protein